MNKKIVISALSAVMVVNIGGPVMAQGPVKNYNTINTQRQINQNETICWVDGVKYNSLSEAVNKAKNWSKITIKGNITLDKEIVIKDKNLIFEFDGDCKINRGNLTGPMFTLEGNSNVKFLNSNIISKLTIDGSSENKISSPAMYIKGNKATLVLNDNIIIENNKVNRNKGGAIVNEGILHLYGVDIRNNEAQEGGAIYNKKGASVYIKGGKIQNNKANTFGGAIYNEGKLEITGGKIFENYARSIGSAICNSGNEYTTKMYAGEIFDNTSYKGSGTGTGIASLNDGKLVISKDAKIYGGNDVYLNNSEVLEIDNNLNGFSENQPLMINVVDNSEGRVVVDFSNEQILNNNYKKIKTNINTIKNNNQIISPNGEVKELLDLIANPFDDNMGTKLKDSFSTDEKINEIKSKIEKIYGGVNESEKTRLFKAVDDIVNYKKYLNANYREIQDSIIQTSQLGSPEEAQEKTNQRFRFDNIDFTGYYLPAGKKSKINVFINSENPEKIDFVIRQVGKTESNDLSSLEPNIKLLKNGLNTFEIDLTDKKYGYAIFVKNNSTSPAKIRIESADASDNLSVLGTQIEKYPTYTYDANNKEAFWDFVKELRKYVKEVEKGTKADMVNMEFGKNLFSLQATVLEDIYSGITKENAAKKAEYFNSKFQERLDLFEKFDGYDKDDKSVNNQPTNQKRHIMYTSTVSNPSTMYARNYYFHMPSHSAREFLLGESMYGWAYSHEYGHMLDNNEIVISEMTNNFYSIVGARQEQISRLQEGTIKEIDVDKAYHPQLKDSQQKIDKYLNESINNKANPSVFENGNVFLQTLALFNGFNYFNNYDYSNYDFSQSPYTIEMAKEVEKYGVYGTAMRILRTNKTAVTNITSNKINRIAVAMTMASGFNYTYLLEKLGVNLEKDVVDFCSQYPNPDVKLEYFSLAADAKLLENKPRYDKNTVASIESKSLNKGVVTLQLTTNGKDDSTIAYEVYRDGQLIGFTRSNTFVDNTANNGLKHKYEVKSYDYRLTPSSNKI